MANSIIPPYYDHQQQTIEFINRTPRYFDTSDPGTGKTRSNTAPFAERRLNGGGRGLVLAPKSILYSAWGADIERFFPHLSYSIAHAENRTRAFQMPSDIYITNHDAVNWLVKNPSVLDGIDTLLIDEFTAYKHRTSSRSKNLHKLINRFDYRGLMSGTPNSNTILDIWHPAFLVDGGQRLGTSFWKFRSQVCNPIQVGPSANMLKWVDKEGIEDVIGLLLQDITIRHAFEDCITIPPNNTQIVHYLLPPNHRATYETLKRTAMLQLNDGTVTPLNEGHLRNKLLQLSSGAVYDSEHEYHTIDAGRYELVIQLVQERPWPCLVAFNWTHERDNLVRISEREGLRYAIIDGTVTKKGERERIVADFQAGQLDVCFAHPRTAAHGLTMTTGRTTIWPSPTHLADYFVQFNKRIPRAGQTETTETLLIAADHTLDLEVYASTDGKITRMKSLLEILQAA